MVNGVERCANNTSAWGAINFKILKFFINKRKSWKCIQDCWPQLCRIDLFSSSCLPLPFIEKPQINSSTDVVKQIRYEINYMIITLQLPESRISSSYYHRLLLYPLLCLFINIVFLIPSFYWFFNAIHVSLSRICVELMRMRKWRELWINSKKVSRRRVILSYGIFMHAYCTTLDKTNKFFIGNSS